MGEANREEHDLRAEICESDDDNVLFELDKFFPYQTRLFYRRVSSAVSQIYEARYGMKPYEWRTIAILGETGEFTANEIVEKSSMDKVTVSRATAALNARGWIRLRKNRKDGRSRLISLTAPGIAAYRDLVPDMLAMQERLLSVYTEVEAAELRRLLSKLIDSPQEQYDQD